MIFRRTIWQWVVCSGLAMQIAAGVGQASDWLRFRGPNGTGISPDQEPLPSSFGESENLKWKTALPGAGVSCPIVVGDRVFVTCYSGYGLDRQSPGEMSALKRHLVCISRADGKLLWEQTVEAVLPEDEYSGMGVPEHGYASHTPVSDGKHVFGFFGKSGVYAWDLDGKQIWHQEVGKSSDDRAWGSSSSPILAGGVLIVPAGAEARAVIGLDAATGRELWKAEGDGLGNVWGTPALSVIDDKRTDVVLGAPYEIWGLNPETGKLRWYCSAMETDQFNSSVLIDGAMIYAVEGRGGGSIAIRAGGKGDVTASNIAWTGNDSNRFSTPLLYEGRLYLISGGTVKCVDASNGREIYQGRLQGGGDAASGGREAGGNGQPPGGGRGRGGFGGGRGGSDYASPVLGDGKIYYVSRSGDIHVLKPGDKLEKLSTNRLTAESEDFSATPAISSGQIFFRSNRHLYCVSGN